MSSVSCMSSAVRTARAGMLGRLAPGLLAALVLGTACVGSPAPVEPPQVSSIFPSLDAPADPQLAARRRSGPMFATVWRSLSGSGLYFGDVFVRGRGLSSVDPSVEAAARASRLRILLDADYGSAEDQGIYAVLRP